MSRNNNEQLLFLVETISSPASSPFPVNKIPQALTSITIFTNFVLFLLKINTVSQ